MSSLRNVMRFTVCTNRFLAARSYHYERGIIQQPSVYIIQQPSVYEEVRIEGERQKERLWKIKVEEQLEAQRKILIKLHDDMGIDIPESLHNSFSKSQ